MKYLLSILFILSLAVFFVFFSHEDPGFVVIGRGNWVVETSLSVFMTLLTLAGLTVYALLKFIGYVWHFPKLFLEKRHTQKTNEALLRATSSLLQDKWRKAELILTKSASISDVGLIHYLGAAYAAYQQQEPGRAEEYLAEARLLAEQNSLPVELFAAKLQLQHQLLPSARQSAQTAYELAPKQEEVLALLYQVHLQLAEWEDLLNLLPELRKRKVLASEVLQQLEQQASIAFIQQTLQQDRKQMSVVWDNLPKTARLKPDVLKVYVNHLFIKGDIDIAEQLIRETLKYHWEEELVVLYGALETVNTAQQISQAESWLKNHHDDAVLLTTLGRLCVRSRSWAKAKQYLDTSVIQTPNPIVYQLLGDLSIKMGEPETAMRYYQQGLSLVLKDTDIAPVNELQYL